MTKQDFDLILIESFVHVSKQSYFNGKREEYKCYVDEYCTGLKDSFDRLNDEVNKPDYEYCEIMFPNGTVQAYIGYARSTIEAKFKDPLDEESQFQIDDCKIVYPHLRTKFEYFGKSITLSVEIMAAIWADLEKYLRSVAPVEPQQKNVLTIKQNALLSFYEGKILKRDNGQKLYQTFQYYSKTCNRTGEPPKCTAKILMNKIELFESIIKLLPDSKKQRATDELNVLKQTYRTEYQ